MLKNTQLLKKFRIVIKIKNKILRYWGIIHLKYNYRFESELIVIKQIFNHLLFLEFM